MTRYSAFDLDLSRFALLDQALPGEVKRASPLPRATLASFEDDLSRFPHNHLDTSVQPDLLEPDARQLGTKLQRALHDSVAEIKDSIEDHLARWPASPLSATTTLFRPMDFGRLETAQTRALAWLIDPAKDVEHGFSSRLLVALLSEIDERYVGSQLKGVTVSAEKSLPLSLPRRHEPRANGGGERIRMDVFARWEQGPLGPGQLVIEAKIDAQESPQQLAKIEEALDATYGQRETAYVFLCPKSQKKNETSPGELWKTLSFERVAAAFSHLLRSEPEGGGVAFLRLYVAGLLADIEGYSLPIRPSKLQAMTLVNLLDRKCNQRLL